MSGVVVIPAIDILEGRCVRLTQGDYSHPKVYPDDPDEVAGIFAAAGAQRLHVVDLDAARGSGDNRSVVTAMPRPPEIKPQVAGGAPTMEAVDTRPESGAGCVATDTAAVHS